jgi:hypothetical protein
MVEGREDGRGMGNPASATLGATGDVNKLVNHPALPTRRRVHMFRTVIAGDVSAAVTACVRFKMAGGR